MIPSTEKVSDDRVGDSSVLATEIHGDLARKCNILSSAHVYQIRRLDRVVLANGSLNSLDTDVFFVRF